MRKFETELRSYWSVQAMDDNRRFHEKIYSAFLMLFDLMPVAAIVNSSYFHFSKYFVIRKQFYSKKREVQH